jgi:hypothetical protein
MEKLKQFLKDDVDMQEVEAAVLELQEQGTKSYLAGLDKDKALELLKSNKALSSAHDSLFAKGLETWKEKTLPGLVDEEYKKRNPPESEEQKRIRALEDKLAQADQERQRVAQLEFLRNKADEVRKEKGISVSDSLLKRYIGQSEEESLSNFNELVEEITTSVNSGVDSEIKKRFPGNNKPQSAASDGEITYKQLTEMSDDELKQLGSEKINEIVAKASGETQ